jgi:hypothetical protein
MQRVSEIGDEVGCETKWGRTPELGMQEMATLVGQGSGMGCGKMPEYPGKCGRNARSVCLNGRDGPKRRNEGLFRNDIIPLCLLPTLGMVTLVLQRMRYRADITAGSLKVPKAGSLAILIGCVDATGGKGEKSGDKGDVLADYLGLELAKRRSK